MAPFDTQRLTMEGLTCRRGERILFENLSFAVERGAGLVLTGPNGVGKTSLLRILAGLLRPTAGVVRLLPAHDIPLPEQSHFIGVRDGLKDSLTPSEHIDFWLASANDAAFAKRGARTRQLILMEFGLTALADAPCGWLSMGQRRRVSLAQLFCASRPLWLLDEPLNGLDQDWADNLRTKAVRYMASGGVIVSASHQPLDWKYMTPLAVGDFAPTPVP